MQIDQETRDGRLVLTPHGSLLCAGPAEQFEALLQNVLAEGHRHLIVVLEQVPHIDSGGIRSLVRGHLTAQRIGGIHLPGQRRPPRLPHLHDDAARHGVSDVRDGRGGDGSAAARNVNVPGARCQVQGMYRGLGSG